MLKSRLRRWTRRRADPRPELQEPPHSTESPRLAVITQVANEGQMMKLWVRHYADQVGIENLVVLDDQSTDGSTDDLGCTVLRLPGMPGRGGFEKARMRLASGLAKGFLACYDYVVFVDADEFIVPDPAKFSGLPDLLAQRNRPAVAGVTALNVVHLPQVEPPLDLGRPILAQRSFAKFTPLMCKPAVKRVPAAWAASSHGIRAPYAVDPDLLMFHLKFADRDRLVAVADDRHARNQQDGRAGRSSWSRSASDLVEVFDGVVRDIDPGTVPEFDVSTAGLESLVEEHDGVHRGPRRGQLQALQDETLVRVPARFKAAF